MITVSWGAPTKNSDGSPIQPGEITGYELGVRPAQSAVGVYPTILEVADPSGAVTALEAAKLPLGSYMAAIRTVGAVDSPWSAETGFKVALMPEAPTDFRITLSLQAHL